MGTLPAGLAGRALALLLAALLAGACSGPSAVEPGVRAVDRPGAVTAVPTPTPWPDRTARAGLAVRDHATAVQAEQDAPAAGGGAAAAGQSTAGESTAGQSAADVASGPTHRVATRVVVPALGIDLPVTRQRAPYPECNVAMYLPQLLQPGQGGATYLYAHARRGMFLPLLERSLVRDGAGMIGMRVEVFTGDNRRFVYRIDEVRRHVRDLRWVERRRNESLWLQTSEGPRGTIPKLQVGASLVSSGPATHAAAHPRPRPITCG